LALDIAGNIHHHGFKRLLLAVSGGVDSICLAHYFISNKDSLGIEWLGIAHVHHGLREETADRDAAFVEAFARKYNVPFFLKKLDGEALKNAEGSLEENAREARYRALFDVTLEAPCADRVHQALDPILSLRSRTASPLQDDITTSRPIIVTAHHAGDQAETMYMRIHRGTTLAGLRGIQETRILLDPSTSQLRCSAQDDTSGVNLFRPFLNVTREELLAYARENKLEWCEDESNDDVKFARNKIRHELLPRLEQECPDAMEQLCRMAMIADRAYAKVIAKCEEVFGTVILDGGSLSAMTLVLNKKKLNGVLREHAAADLSELFRLWLSEQGLRFPIGFFYGDSEPAHVKIPHRAAYRRRSVAKIGHTVQICEFSTPEEAQKFVSCREKDKGL
jgi:tRNA(Ile)-lysidine synthase